MAEHSLTAADFAGEPPGRVELTERKKVAAKYSGPGSGATCMGRGLEPKWLQSALVGRMSLTYFAI
jgi:DNA-binding protein H-NS